jgi:hypothetical protein
LAIALSRRGRVVDFILIGLAVFFCLGTLLARIPRPAASLPEVREAFDPALRSIDNMDEATRYVSARASGNDQKSLADAADDFVRRRFYHSYSFFDPSEDWLAYLAGFAWINLRSPVLPDDILQHPEAACSQQVIVFQALVRRLGLDAGTVVMDHHMNAAVKIAGRWQIYDADLEISPRSYPLDRLLAGDPAVLAIYGKIGRSIDLAGQAAAGRIQLRHVDSNPAPQASLFHHATRALSDYGWALFLALLLLRIRRPRSPDRKFAVPSLAK